MKEPTKQSAPTQVFIVDDHLMLREMLQMLLEREADIAVFGTAATAAEALGALGGEGEVGPDLVLVDIWLPDMSGIELVRALRQRHPDLLLAILSGHGERSHVEGALKAGAHGYILKGRGQELAPAIRQLVRGQPYLSEALRQE